MGILSFFRNRRDSSPSAAVAKGRLQVLIAHERTNRNGPEYLPQLKQDIVDVIKKYVNVGEDQVMVKLDTQDNREVLELNITLPEDADDASSAAVSITTKTADTSNGSSQSSETSKSVGAAETVKSTATSADRNKKGNGKNKAKSSGKKRKGNKKSRRR